jgi:hypothetical protein
MGLRAEGAAMASQRVRTLILGTAGRDFHNRFLDGRG